MMRENYGQFGLFDILNNPSRMLHHSPKILQKAGMADMTKLTRLPSCKLRQMRDLKQSLSNLTGKFEV